MVIGFAMHERAEDSRKCRKSSLTSDRLWVKNKGRLYWDESFNKFIGHYLINDRHNSPGGNTVVRQDKKRIKTNRENY